ncbi:hypothetical protein ACQ4LE_000489 [Meloidogyne hapla]
MDLIKNVYYEITENGVYDPRKGYAVPVTSALIDGLIYAYSGGIYINPTAQECLSLKDANNRGFIDSLTLRALTEPFLTDYRTQGRINLIQAVEAKLIDLRAKTVKLSTDKIVSLQKAIEEGAIHAEVGVHLRRVKTLTFDKANFGSVDKRKLGDMLTQFGYRLSDRFYNLAIQKFDSSHSGTIKFDDFIQLCVFIQNLTTTFNKFDIQKNGVIKIRYENFLEMIWTLKGKLCFELQPPEVAFRNLDTDNDGLLSLDFEDFLLMIFNLKT